MAEDKDVSISSPDISTAVCTKNWKAGRPIERIHGSKYSAKQFNPGINAGAGARFSPFQDSLGNNVPTLYGGESSAVALMETVFHDLPVGCAGLNFALSKLEGRVRSQLVPEVDLPLVDITPMTMRRWGITQALLLGSEVTDYQVTQKWAARIHRDNPEARGIQWPSKQHGGAALMLFGDRMKEGDLRVATESEAVMASKDVMSALFALADELDIALIPKDMQ